MVDSYKFHSRASLSLHYRSPDGASAEQTQRCYGEWRNIAAIQVLVFKVISHAACCYRCHTFRDVCACASRGWWHELWQVFLSSSVYFVSWKVLDSKDLWICCRYQRMHIESMPKQRSMPWRARLLLLRLSSWLCRIDLRQRCKTCFFFFLLNRLKWQVYTVYFILCLLFHLSRLYLRHTRISNESRYCHIKSHCFMLNRILLDLFI